MAELGNEQYQALLAKHLAMNQQTWRRLQELGVTTSTSLRLDFSYRAPERKAAEALKDLLADQTDYDVQVERSGSLPPKEWSVRDHPIDHHLSRSAGSVGGLDGHRRARARMRVRRVGHEDLDGFIGWTLEPRGAARPAL